MVRASDNGVAEIVLRSLCAVVLLAAVALVVLHMTVGNDNDGYFGGAWVCGFVLILLGILVYARARNRLEVGRWGILIAQGRKRRSILWDQLKDVTVEVAQGPDGETPPLVRPARLPHTNGEVRSSAAGGLNTTRGRVRRVAATIRNYRDHVRAGTATWV